MRRGPRGSCSTGVPMVCTQSLPGRGSCSRSRNTITAGAEVDLAPIIDETSGQICDFINAPTRFAVACGREALSGWRPRRMRLRSCAAALHFIAYRPIRMDALLRGDEAARDRIPCTGGVRNPRRPAGLSCCACGRPGVAHVLQRLDRRIRQTQPATPMHVEGERLVVTPDPFAGHQFSIEIQARELTDPSFTLASDAARAYRPRRLSRYRGTCRRSFTGRSGRSGSNPSP